MTSNGVAPKTIIEDEDEFLNDVDEYMRQRGVPFDRDGKVAGRPAPLHKLYTLVMSRGGYDAVSDTRMAWREICSNFSFPKAHDGAMSYQLKQLYYKNLAAYEIEKYWGETPPPPSLLEHTTAKGGDVRKRTQAPQAGAAPSVATQNSDDMEVDSPSQTPKKEKVELDDQESASRYPSRLRQQPKPVQQYLPDPTPSRVMRPRATHSPQPAASYNHNSFSNSSSNPRDPNFKIENYEPRAPVPLTLRPLVTPGSNSDVFYQRKAMAKIKPVQRTPLPQDLLKYTLPRAAFDGPNIYVRCVQGLRSGIRREQEFALHHLVKVSHERGDKFKFEGFPTLAEALMEKVVEVAELAYGVPFQVSYLDPRGRSAENTLNAVHGTENLLQKLKMLPEYVEDNEIEPEDYAQRLDKVNEATLVIRNMVTLEENAFFLSKMALFRDLLILLLNLPRQARFDEVRQYALDMAEMTTRYWNLLDDDELYQSLVNELSSNDRGKIIRALGAIYRFDAEADRVHALVNIPVDTLEELMRCCMLEDDEFVEAVINFLYAWSSFPEDVARVTEQAPTLLPTITLRLTNFLTRGASNHVLDQRHNLNPYAPRQQQQSTLAPASIPNVPHDLHQEMLKIAEPDRSARWLRCCFEEAPHSDVTQISIWQAYQQRFMQNNHIAAADFIKQVSSTIHGAQAQVVQGPQGNRFIIRGIRPRRVLVNMRGEPYYKCHWEVPIPVPANYTGPPLVARNMPCPTWHATPEALWKHLLSDHGKVPMTPDGKFQAKDVQIPEGGYVCKWISCQKHNTLDSPASLGRHLRMHVPMNAEQNRALIYKLAGEKTEDNKDIVSVSHTFVRTAVDEKGYPMGIPFMSALLLRNLARYVGRYGGNDKQRDELMGQLFSTKVRENLWTAFSKQTTICVLILEIIDLIEKGEAAEKKARREEDQHVSVF